MQDNNYLCPGKMANKPYGGSVSFVEEVRLYKLSCIIVIYYIWMSTDIKLVYKHRYNNNSLIIIKHTYTNIVTQLINY